MGEKIEKLKELIPPRKLDLQLFEHQKKCIDILESQPPGSRSLVTMATGLGKTGCFTHIPDHGEKTLIVSLGREIVFNPLQYYPEDYPVGVEMETFDAKRDFPEAQVISASVLSLINRLDNYNPTEFRNIIIDEAHHSTAPSYRKIIDYFRPRHLIGFTATPRRADGVSLASVYRKHVFSRNLMWGIKNGFLCDIHYTKVPNHKADLRNIRVNRNDGSAVADFDRTELAKALADTPAFIRDVYKDYARGPVIIFVAGKRIAYKTAALIPGAVAITDNMPPPERNLILQAYREGKVRCLITVGVLREGVDLPCTETIILARPTLSPIVYTQMVGRGTRIFPGKPYLNLVEMESVYDERIPLCDATCLLGITTSTIPRSERDAFNRKNLTEMETIAKEISDKPKNWLLSRKSAQDWADREGYDTHNVNWLLLPDGALELTFANPSRQTGASAQQVQFRVPPPDMLGSVTVGQTRMDLQLALDLSYAKLERLYPHRRSLWDKDKIERGWGSAPPTPVQLRKIKENIPNVDVSALNKQSAAELIAKINKEASRIVQNKQHVKVIYPVSPDEPPKKWIRTETVTTEAADILVYDYMPDWNCVSDISKKDLTDKYTAWLRERLEIGYKACQGNVEVLIDRLNASKREGYWRLFVAQNLQLRYLRSLDEVPISRRDLIDLFSVLTDRLIPAILCADILREPHAAGKVLDKVKVEMHKAPYNRIVCQFQETVAILSSERRQARLPKYAAEIRKRDMDRWEGKEKKSKAKKKKATTKSKAKNS